MKKNKYAASLDTINRPQNKAGNKKTDCYDDAAIARAIEEGERRNYERLVVAVSTLSGYHGPLYAGNVIQRIVSSHYPRPEVKEKPFLNSDFLKTVSNG